MSFNPLFSKLGEILVHEGYVSQDQVKEGLSKQVNFGLKIGETLVKLGYLAEKDLLKALHLQLEFDVVSEDMLAELEESVVALIPEPFATANRLIAVSDDGDSVTVAMTDPDNVVVLDGLKKIINKRIVPVLIGDNTLTDTLEKYYKTIRTSNQMEDAVGDFKVVAFDEDDEKEIEIDSGNQADAPVVKLVNLILTEAIKSGTTDIHIEPLSNQSRVRFRIDGALREVMSPPLNMHPGMISLIKVMSKLNIAERRLPQDGHISLKTAVKAVDVRVSITPTVTGEKAVLRLLDKGDFGFSLKTIGFEDDQMAIFQRWIHRPYGIIIVSGPTGSGKSTTLHSALKEIKSVETNIITCEDPVEYRLDGITQIEVKEKIGLTFGSALRSVLRQDPDVVLIGEIRDEETADIAIKFSLTGHLVFSTLHANDAPSTVTRIVDIGVAPFLVGTSLNLVMAQRLVRKICSHCKTDYTPTEQELGTAGISAEEAKNIDFKIGSGCVHCENTGYAGREAIFEILEVNSAIRRLIFDKADADQIRNTALENGMQTLHDSALHKMRKGITTIREVNKFTITDD